MRTGGAQAWGGATTGTWATQSLPGCHLTMIIYCKCFPQVPIYMHEPMQLHPNCLFCPLVYYALHRQHYVKYAIPAQRCKSHNARLQAAFLSFLRECPHEQYPLIKVFLNFQHSHHTQTMYKLTDGQSALPQVVVLPIYPYQDFVCHLPYPC